MRNNSEKLRDMLEAIERIERYAVLGKQNFEQNELVQVWLTQNLQIIGEAKVIYLLCTQFCPSQPTWTI